MGIEKREGDAPLPTGSVLDPDTPPTGPEAPTADIVDGDEVVKTAEEIAGEMNAENPDGPEYAPKGTIPEPPLEGEGGVSSYADDNNRNAGSGDGDKNDNGDDEKKSKKGTPAGTPL